MWDALKMPQLIAHPFNAALAAGKAHAYRPSTEVGRLLWVWGSPRLQSETVSRISKGKQNVMAHAFNMSTLKAEAGGTLEFKDSEHGLHSESYGSQGYIERPVSNNNSNSNNKFADWVKYLNRYWMNKV